jgi:hypothetical protein
VSQKGAAIADRRGRNVATVEVARKLLTLSITACATGTSAVDQARAAA